MARTLAGADYVIGGIGGLVGIGASAQTLLTICKRGANGAWQAPLSIETSANSSKLSLEFSDTNTIQLIIGTSNKDTTVPITVANNWVLAAVTRGSGSAVPRGHKYVYDGDTWTHTDAAAASGGDSTDLTGGRIQIGRWQTTDFYNGDILLVAAWKRALTDAEIELLPFTLQALVAAAPDALWLLDQSATTQNVIDTTGNGANQTSVVNTSIATSSPPVWNYGLGASVGVGQAGGAAGVAQAGTSVVGLSASGTAKKVVAQTGTCALGAAATGTGRKVAPKTGTAALGVAGLGTGKKVAVEGGRDVLALANFGVGTAPRPQTGVAALAFATSGAGRKVAPTGGRDILALVGAGSGAKRAPERGTVGLALATRATTGTDTRAVTGVLVLGFRPYNHNCITHRPVGGITTNPVGDITPRPDSGVTAAPC